METESKRLTVICDSQREQLEKSREQWRAKEQQLREELERSRGHAQLNGTGADAYLQRKLMAERAQFTAALSQAQADKQQTVHELHERLRSLESQNAALRAQLAKPTAAIGGVRPPLNNASLAKRLVVVPQSPPRFKTVCSSENATRQVHDKIVANGDVSMEMMIDDEEPPCAPPAASQTASTSNAKGSVGTNRLTALNTTNLPAAANVNVHGDATSVKRTRRPLYDIDSLFDGL